MRLIDADALIQKRNHAKAYAQDMYVIGQGYVMDAPTIDATPIVHGKWISMGGCRCDCSVCGGTVLGRTDRTGWADSAFCGYCGAKMDGQPRNADTCVCCGDTIPEGRQTCPNCEAGAGIYSGTRSEFAVSKCSACGKEQFSISHVVKDGNYCPDCGAYMRGEGAE